MSDKNPTPKKRGPGNPTKYKKDHCKVLVEKMSEGFSYEAIAGFIGVCRDTLYEWEKHHPEWVEAKKLGFSRSQTFWERIGLEGIYMGGKDAPFQPSMWIFNMKNRFKWTDRVEQKVDQKVSLESLVGGSFDDEDTKKVDSE